MCIDCDAMAMAFSRRFFPIQHQGHMVSETMETRSATRLSKADIDGLISFFSDEKSDRQF